MAEIPISLINPHPLKKTDVSLDSLQETMDINKEVLERRLLLRRTLPELVELGIYPTLSAPPAYVEQSRNLERAKARDLLQKKLKLRPDRKCLVQHHILEDTNPLVDRSLQDKQRLLKRSRLQDNLRDHLAHRPGPLELLSKNILLLNTGNNDFTIASANSPKETLYDFAIPDFASIGFSKADYPNVTITSEDLYQIPATNSGSISSFDSLADISIAESDLSSPEGPNFLSYSLDSGICIPPAPDIRPLLLSNPSMVIPKSATSPPPQLQRPISPVSGTKINKNKVTRLKFHEYKGPKPPKDNKTLETTKIDPENLRTMVEQERQVLAWRLSDQTRGAGDVEMSIEELRSRLDDLRASQLKEICKQLSIKASGPKPDLINRIIMKLIDGENGDMAHQNLVQPVDSKSLNTLPISSDDLFLNFSSLTYRQNESVHIFQGKNQTVNKLTEPQIKTNCPIDNNNIDKFKHSFIKMAHDMGLSVEELLSRLNLQLTNNQHQKLSCNIFNSNFNNYFNGLVSNSTIKNDYNQQENRCINVRNGDDILNQNILNKTSSVSHLDNFNPAFHQNMKINNINLNDFVTTAFKESYRSKNIDSLNGLSKSQSAVFLEENLKSYSLNGADKLCNDYFLLPKKLLPVDQSYNQNLALTPNEILIRQQIQISQLQNDLIRSQQQLMEANLRAMKDEPINTNFIDDKNLYADFKIESANESNESLLEDVLNIINNDSITSSCQSYNCTNHLSLDSNLNFTSTPPMDSNPLTPGTIPNDDSSLMDVFDGFTDSGIYPDINNYLNLSEQSNMNSVNLLLDNKKISQFEEKNSFSDSNQIQEHNSLNILNSKGSNEENRFLDTSFIKSNLFIQKMQTSNLFNSANYQNKASDVYQNITESNILNESLFFNSNWVADNFLEDYDMDFGMQVASPENNSIDLDIPIIGTFDL